MREKLDKELKINIFTIAFLAVIHLCWCKLSKHQ